jgi:GNAT superfamily N-acetyltransferase
MLSTHPDHERRGAGSMLVKWGTDIADSLGMKAFVQGSRVGKPLYESHGFVDSEGWITVPVTERHKNRPAVGWFNLERPAKTLKTAAEKDSV